MAVAYNIPVNIPQVPGAPLIDFTELKSKVQDYVNSLYVHRENPQKESACSEHKYSKRLQHLREMSRKVTITEEDIRNDERLAYLLSK